VTESLPREGYLYVACGPPNYVRDAARSARSVRAADPEAHVTLVVDRDPSDALGEGDTSFDRIDVRPQDEAWGNNKWKRGLSYKVQHAGHAPYERTLFLDTDTYAISSLRPLFALLDHHDLVMAPSADFNVPVPELEPYTPYNSGMIAYRRNETTQALFEGWLRHSLERPDDPDQWPFMRTLLESTAKLCIVKSVWNVRTPYMSKMVGPARMIHGKHDDMAAVAAELNRTTDDRVWIPRLGVCISLNDTPWQIQQRVNERVAEIQREEPERLTSKGEAEGQPTSFGPTDGGCPSLQEEEGEPPTLCFALDGQQVALAHPERVLPLLRWLVGRLNENQDAITLREACDACPQLEARTVWATLRALTKAGALAPR
jgi:hypothetical protein